MPDARSKIRNCQPIHEHTETHISISSLHIMPLCYCATLEPSFTSSTSLLPVQGYPNPDPPFSLKKPKTNYTDNIQIKLLKKPKNAFFFGRKCLSDLSSHTDFSWLPSTGLEGQREVAPPRPHWDGLNIIFENISEHKIFEEMCCSARECIFTTLHTVLSFILMLQCFNITVHVEKTFSEGHT